MNRHRRPAPGRVFDRVTDLEGVPDGYRAMSEREAIKVLIEFSAALRKGVIVVIGRVAGGLGLSQKPPSTGRFRHGRASSRKEAACPIACLRVAQVRSLDESPQEQEHPEW